MTEVKNRYLSGLWHYALEPLYWVLRLDFMQKVRVIRCESFLVNSSDIQLHGEGWIVLQVLFFTKLQPGDAHSSKTFLLWHV